MTINSKSQITAHSQCPVLKQVFVLLLLVSNILLSETALAERFVIVNGQRMSDSQIRVLEQVRCGPIPNGNYWLNFYNGLWGYAGNPRPQGNIIDNCINPGRRPSLSERGQLFTPHDWVR